MARVENRMSGRRARSGFTLVELVMVLAVFSLVAGLAMPRYASAGVRYRVKAAAHRIASDIALARNTARTRSTSMAIVFKPGVPGYYEIAGVRHLDRNEVYRNILSEEPYRVRLIEADFGGVTELTFNGHGIGTDGKVQVGAQGWVASLQVDGITGTVEIAGP